MEIFYSFTFLVIECLKALYSLITKIVMERMLLLRYLTYYLQEFVISEVSS